jgi:glycosyltransferase involved in cell wall biosynthesis
MQICVSDGGPLRPMQDAGSRAVCDAIAVLEYLGNQVTYLPVSQVSDLTDFDRFICSRPGPALNAMQIPGFKKIPTVYFGHDLHFQRMSGHMHAQQVAAIRRIESICWRNYDKILYPLKSEAQLVNEYLGQERAIAIPIFTFNTRKKTSHHKTQLPSCVFVGSTGHAPNIAAVALLFEEIWPRIRLRFNATLHLVGNFPLKSTYDLTCVVLHQDLSEVELDSLVASAWVSIAPLTFGAGVKRKVLHSLSVGTPVIGTTTAFQGIAWKDGRAAGGLVAETSQQLAECVIELLLGPQLLEELSRDGLQFVTGHFSMERVAQAWESVIAP